MLSPDNSIINKKKQSMVAVCLGSENWPIEFIKVPCDAMLVPNPIKKIYFHSFYPLYDGSPFTPYTTEA